jgi:hypothetical protein
MNLVERFFRDLTEDVVREGSFGSTEELARAIAISLCSGSSFAARTVQPGGWSISMLILRSKPCQAVVTRPESRRQLTGSPMSGRIIPVAGLAGFAGRDWRRDG